MTKCVGGTVSRGEVSSVSKLPKFAVLKSLSDACILCSLMRINISDYYQWNGITIAMLLGFRKEVTVHDLHQFAISIPHLVLRSMKRIVVHDAEPRALL